MKIIIPISVGELLDKISILLIKRKYTNSLYVKKELKDLILIAKQNKVYSKYYLRELLKINKKLWLIEDNIRLYEKNKIFNDEFISLARSVYTNNDKRFLVKKSIDEKFNSTYSEVKCY